MTPQTNRRWMRAALEGSAKCDIAMPWGRGGRRAQMLARRAAPAAIRARACHAGAAPRSSKAAR
ncbi:hypothetical protein CKO11_12265 [Rhodobacter sp. TJ_12]|nr:hypothetical protein [Rhodobacter sp. TJ_12]